MTDGTVIQADVVILAIGYERSYRKMLENILPTEVVASMGDFWGLNEEGELNGVNVESGKLIATS